LATTDYTEEDFNRYGELQALGFVGEHSEMMCLYRLMTALEQDNATSKKNLSQSSIISVNYYTDYREMGIQDELNMYERPEQSMADQLIDTYFRMIHPSFPLIGKTTFLAQYHSFYSDPSARPGKQWLAVLNFVFAIAANHLSPAEKVAGVGYFLHLGYFSRAWMLSMDKAALRNYPNLQQIQVEGLAALYLLANGQVNRYFHLPPTLNLSTSLANNFSLLGHGGVVVLHFALHWLWGSICVVRATMLPLYQRRLGIECGGLCASWIPRCRR
jgi:hypothetical protein